MRYTLLGGFSGLAYTAMGDVLRLVGPVGEFLALLAIDWSQGSSPWIITALLLAGMLLGMGLGALADINAEGADHIA